MFIYRLQIYIYNLYYTHICTYKIDSYIRIYIMCINRWSAEVVNQITGSTSLHRGEVEWGGVGGVGCGQGGLINNVSLHVCTNWLLRRYGSFTSALQEAVAKWSSSSPYRKKLLLRYVKFHLSSIWTRCYPKWNSFYVYTNSWVADNVAFHLQTDLIHSCTFILIWCYFALSSLALANSPNYVSIVDARLPSFSLWSSRPFPSSWRISLSNET